MIYLWIIVSLVFSAMFSGSEIAFFSADKMRLEIDKSKGDWRIKILNVFFNNPNKFVTTLLLGNNIALVVYGLLSSRLLQPYLENIISNSALLLFLQSLIGTIIILFIGEFIPKIIFRNNSNLMVRALSPILILIYFILYPFVFVINLISTFILVILGRKKDDINLQPTLSTVDLEHYLNSNKSEEGEVGELDTEVKIIQNVIEFPTLRVRDCMLPRNEVVAVDINASLEELEERFVRSGHTKIVVYKQNIDDIIGYIHSSEIFRANDWQKRIVKAVFVPESMFASVLMKNLMSKKISMAIVIDEMGGTSGIVTLEDLVEEIFGDIEDEHDRRKIVAKQVDEKTYIFSGRMEIDDINEQFSLSLPEDDEYMTLAGFIIHHLQRIPSNGEVIDIDNWQFEIMQSSSTKIVLVRLRII